MKPRIYSSFGCFYRLIADRTITHAGDIKDRMAQAALDGLEINAYVPGLVRLLGFDLELSDLAGVPLSLHSNHVDHNLASLNRFTRQAGIEQIRAETALAQAKGMHPVTFHPGKASKRLPREQSISLLMKSLDQIITMILPEDTQNDEAPLLCLENMDDKAAKLCNQESEIEEVLDRYPQIGLTVDFAHLGLRGAGIDAFLRRFGDRIRHAHVSGVQAGKPHGEISLDRSEVDLMPYLRSMKHMDIAVVIENGEWNTMLRTRESLEEAFA